MAKYADGFDEHGLFFYLYKAEAFQTLIHNEKEKLYKMAYVYMQNEDDALEVFQETVYKAFKSIAALKNNDYFSTWATRILINTAIELLKKKQKIVPLSQEILENMGEAWRDYEWESVLKRKFTI